jgi:hypothetical protein
VSRRQNTTKVSCPGEDRLETEGTQGAPNMDSVKEGIVGENATYIIRVADIH